MEGSGKRSIAQGNSAAAVNRESKKPEIFQTVIWVAGILGTGALMLLLSVLVFLGGSTPQPSVAKVESALAKQLRELKEEALAAEDMTRRRDAQAQQQTAPPMPPADVPSDLPTGEVLELADLAELVGPSVVQVNVTGPKKAGTGSGFVLDKQGTIVTNYHVIEDATVGTIVFSDRTSAPITGYLGVWPEKDIALIRVECPQDKLHPIRLATSAPRQGERVAAFGSPLGLQQSVSEGIVSAVRESEELRTLFQIDIDALLIQTTTPISQGNSGGPLVDMKGMVVGVNTMGLSGGENLNFAVAIAELPPLLLARSEIASPLPFRDPTVNEVERIVKRAKDHYGAGDYNGAIADYTEVIQLDPKNASAYYWRAIVYDDKRDHDSAFADYTKAIRLDPKNARAYRRRAMVYNKKGDLHLPLATDWHQDPYWNWYPNFASTAVR
jgi:S1-C subfamily serine protease